MLSERSQTQKTTYCMIPLKLNAQKGKSIGTESGLAVAWDLGRNEDWHKGSYWGDENVLQLDYGDGWTTQ